MAQTVTFASYELQLINLEQKKWIFVYDAISILHESISILFFWVCTVLLYKIKLIYSFRTPVRTFSLFSILFVYKKAAKNRISCAEY